MALFSFAKYILWKIKLLSLFVYTQDAKGFANNEGKKYPEINRYPNMKT